MENGRIGARRLRAAAWAAVLAPAVGVLPGAAVRQAGMGAWLAPLAALPVMLLLGRALEKLSHRGLAETFVTVLGKSVGGALTTIYIMWALMLGSARLRLGGRRLLFTAQRATGLWLAPVVLVLLAVWLACGRAESCVRAAAVFSRVLALALLAVLGLTVFRIKAENLLPLWSQDAVPVLRGVVPVLGVLGYGVYAAFLRESDETGGDTGRIVGACGVLLLLLVAVLGNLGVELTAALEDPFLTLSKQIGAEGAFQRVESLVSALWLLADLALLALLLLACRRMVGVLLPGCKGWVVVLAAALAISAGALLVFRDPRLAGEFETGPGLWGNVVLGAGVPLLLAAVATAKESGGGISCVEDERKRQIWVLRKPREKNSKKSEKRC